MNKRNLIAGFSTAAFLTTLAQAGGGGAAASLSEYRLDMPGADVEEYVELAGVPGASLDGLSFVIIGDGTGASGVCETAVDLTGQVINANGYFVIAKSTFTLGTADLTDDSMSFENSDNVTYMLVDGFGNAVGDDLDTDDSGDLEALVGTVVDSLSIIETVGSGDLVYGTQEIGPDGTFVPASGRKCDSGWVISPFGDFSEDTPGADNNCPTPPPSVETVAYESFDYTVGLGIGNGNGFRGQGWLTEWWAGNAGDHGIITTPGFDAIGHKLTTNIENQGTFRLPLASAHPDLAADGTNFGSGDGVMWIRFQAQREDPIGDVYGGFSLFTQFGAEHIFIGMPGGAEAWGMEAAGAGQAIVAGSSPDTMAQLVVKLTFTSAGETAELWVDPADAYPSTAPDASLALPDFTWNEVRFQSGVPQTGGVTGFSFDNLLIEKESSGPPPPTPGDQCADAIAVVAGANAFDTTGLSDSGYHDGSCVSRDGFTDIWFVYTAGASGDHTFDTCGSDFDTVLRVLDSADCATAACIAGNDDACALSSGSNFASSVTANLTAGQSYLVHVEGWGASDAGAGTLTIAEPDTGDTCAEALPVVAGANAFDTTGLSDSGYHDGSCVSRDGFTDIWFVYTAAITGDHVLNTCGSDFDTVLRVLDSADCATAACIAGNDDACALSSGSNFASEVTVSLTSGQSYLVHVEGWGASDAGAGTLTITEPSADNGDDCSQALPVVDGANAFDTTALTDSGYHDGSCVSRDGFTDIWFVYTASVDGDHVLGTCGSDFDTVLRVLDSADCATAACIAGNDDACAISSGSSFASEVTATLTAGQSYLVHVEGWGASDVGAGTLTITPPSACDGNDDLFTTVFANGDCANASPLVSGVYTGLTVCKDRLDFYTFTVADGATLDAQIQFATATNDLDMFLYDAATCIDDPADPGCTGSLECGYSASDNETISWTNTTGADLQVVLRVNIWANDAADIGTYDMSISGIASSSVSVVCTPPNANSTGGAVTIGASNSGFFTSGGAPVTWLNATGGPDGEFGYFLVSATYAEPGVSVADGLLCLTGGIGRYNGEAGNNNALRNSTGTFVASATGGLSVFECANGLTIGGAATGFNVPDQLPWINGSSIPAPNIQPGDTWNFQMWYRDGASSNFSDAVSVQF